VLLATYSVVRYVTMLKCERLQLHLNLPLKYCTVVLVFTIHERVEVPGTHTFLDQSMLHRFVLA
jgi:hypothetical protein